MSKIISMCNLKNKFLKNWADVKWGIIGEEKTKNKANLVEPKRDGHIYNKFEKYIESRLWKTLKANQKSLYFILQSIIINWNLLKDKYYDYQLWRTKPLSAKQGTHDENHNNSQRRNCGNLSADQGMPSSTVLSSW